MSLNQLSGSHPCSAAVAARRGTHLNLGDNCFRGPAQGVPHLGGALRKSKFFTGTIPTMTLLFNALALLATGAVGALHLSALEHAWYWLHPNADVPVHFLAGLAIGFWCSAVSWRLSLSPARAVWLFLAVALGAGALWEVSEYMLGLTPFSPSFIPDTAVDMSINIVGAFAAFLLFVGLRRLNRHV